MLEVYKPGSKVIFNTADDMPARVDSVLLQENSTRYKVSWFVDGDFKSVQVDESELTSDYSGRKSQIGFKVGR